MPADRPYVVAHLAVSLDGATTGFPIDVGAYYALVPTWKEDVTLTGADTILAQEGALGDDGPGPSPDGPLLAVVDSRSRVHSWAALRDCGLWRRVVAVRSERSAPDPDVVALVAGHDRVDLATALAVLGDDGAATVRVDSGGQLVRALLDDGLVDELSLLVHPCVAGAEALRGTVPPWTAGHGVDLDLISQEQYADGLVWLRYHVRSEGELP
jgi:2,5-diamino-6-(ribosylamino)-4(3H)-pyrimidinone 5'-phosphate reductase